jgi:DNA-binding XRE family transcriptional regulator
LHAAYAVQRGKRPIGMGEIHMTEIRTSDQDHFYLNKNTSRHLGIILKQARHNKSLSQNSLSEAANINNSYYCSIERGTVNVTVRKFMSICEGLHVKPEEIMRKLQSLQETKKIYDEDDLAKR